MSYAEMSEKVSNQEFELWMALAGVESEECPNCGRSAREIGQWVVEEQKCIFCDHKYQKVKGT